MPAMQGLADNAAGTCGWNVGTCGTACSKNCPQILRLLAGSGRAIHKQENFNQGAVGLRQLATLAAADAASSLAPRADIIPPSRHWLARTGGIAETDVQMLPPVAAAVASKVPCWPLVAGRAAGAQSVTVGGMQPARSSHLAKLGAGTYG